MSVQEVLTLTLGTLGTAIALATLVNASLEYIRRGRMERMQVFFDLRRRLKEPELNEVAQLIDEAREPDKAISELAARKLAETSFRVKRDYLGLFEEIGFAVERGLIEPEIAHYMFGYYALHCAGCDAFWIGVGELNPYWNRFYEFCAQMQAEREDFARHLEPIDRSIFRTSSSGAMPPGTTDDRR
jgi:hypothetical protein